MGSIFADRAKGAARPGSGQTRPRTPTQQWPGPHSALVTMSAYARLQVITTHLRQGLSDFSFTRGFPSEAEGVPGWVSVDTEAWLGARQARGTQCQYPGLGLGDVADLKVQVDLRWKRRVRPARGLVARDTLEAQAAAVGITDLCPALLSPG